MTDDGILAQILSVVTELQVTVNERLDRAEDNIESITKRLDLALSRAFHNGDLDAHRVWHQQHALPAWRRKLITWLE
ncbi:hypothetical protein CPT_Mendera_203 [Stenotrophomonas phage Mendera]|uniref:Uncharacterized protein n=2 Tax=Menderavirus TaxID=2843421 RepID=A0A5P8PML5_9CAUD|nr:hypothetical protein HWC58_gp201 [Stenotrophomonas phage Moby]YP_009851237.1 hypothetical protein HWC60_gp212 [Stenotrophomonas phage Mendera]QXN67279.1 hypothetical protein [Stenotrophomonas phage BUCT608]QYW02718.1 hypothetical protein CPT_Marzo_200 [Stenotrophomonas phage Marzo]QFR56729.1 hypothetical protein CPT_Mendera_203 [Stenotrophomonas phage Mendera]QFR57922.1 hypothetical protein CPT_Moby_197 [Stenotrophomonas phage Moby]QYC97416.1 hypothetical protein [Stenotrophomonas phage BU